MQVNLIIFRILLEEGFAAYLHGLYVLLLGLSWGIGLQLTYL